MSKTISIDRCTIDNQSGADFFGENIPHQELIENIKTAREICGCKLFDRQYIAKTIEILSHASRGRLLYCLGYENDAIMQLNTGIEYAALAGDLLYQGKCYLEIGSINLNKGNHQFAGMIFDKILALGEPNIAGYAYYNIGIIFEKRKLQLIVIL